MTEQKNHAPQPISDEELDSATGGAVGINPLLLLAGGAQGIYTPTAEPAPVTHGTNPLYVDNTSLAGPTAPVYIPHAVVPAPTPTVSAPTPTPPVHESVVVLVDPSASSLGMGHSLNISSVAVGSIALSGTLGMSNSSPVDVPKGGSQVTVLTLDHTPSFTTVTPVVHGLREVEASVGVQALNTAFIGGGVPRPPGT